MMYEVEESKMRIEDEVYYNSFSTEALSEVMMLWLTGDS